MYLLVALLAFVLSCRPDCRCGHPAAQHFPPSILSGFQPCRKRSGWRRRRCQCAHYGPSDWDQAAVTIRV